MCNCVRCSYLLGLLAMIKCSICSYQCDNWYVSNWRLACHINFSWGSVFSSLLRSLQVLHQACTLPGGSTPFGVTSHWIHGTIATTVLIWEWDAKPKATGAEHNGTTFHPSPCYKFYLLVGFALTIPSILAEGAIALSVTLSGGALFASWKLLQFPSSLIVKVILAIFRRASAQHTFPWLQDWEWKGSGKPRRRPRRRRTILSRFSVIRSWLQDWEWKGSGKDGSKIHPSPWYKLYFSVISSFYSICKLTWLVLGGDPAARSHRVEQFTALWGL